MIIILAFCITGVLLYYTHILPSKYYKRISEVDFDILYGWRVEPRYYKRNPALIFTFPSKDSIDYCVKEPCFYSMSEEVIAFPMGYSYNSFDAKLGYGSPEELENRIKLIVEVFRATGADRLISDLCNPDVMYFSYGRKIVIYLMYIPLTIENESRSILIAGYKKINESWYYDVHFRLR